MPINVYTGLMRSGKSYEVVSEVIVPAIRSGRRVVTNVEGISEEKIHQYLAKLHPNDAHDKYGNVLHVNNNQVFDERFFPYYDDEKTAHTDTLVQPGDLVCIDEAWRFWGSDGSKVHKNHRSFFLEHGHFTNPETNVACDLVLMIQDFVNLDRKLKSVVAFNFRTHKKVALGLSNTYSLTMWEGYKQTKGAQIGNWVRKYRKEIFPLYSSFKGGAQGVLVNADGRQNIFKNKKLWGMLAVLIIGGSVSAYNIYKFFNPVPVGKDGKPLQTAPAASAAVVDASGRPVPLSPPVPRPPAFSEVWRLSGSFQANGQAWVVMVNEAGRVRVASPSEFNNTGLAQVGEIDGAKVTSWSGSGAGRPAAFGSSVAPAEVKK